ncbi:MAG: adenylate cyclase [Verrucomicrobiota bacterium]|jgi:TolB-like protein/Tfp pilus assembly protein PilF
MKSQNFFAELKRRNVYKVAVAYAVIGWLVMQVSATIVPALHLPDGITTAAVVLVLIGFPVALVIAWAFEMTPEGMKRTEDVGPNEVIPQWSGRKFAALIIVMAIGAAALLTYQLLRPKAPSAAPSAVQPANAPSKSIAVLPFVNMSSDKENEYFVDGLTEEILNRLAQITELKVPGRTSSFAFKEKNSDLRLIGSALGVAHVLEGSVRKSGNRLRITTQLVRTADGFHLWSQNYDRKLDDVFAIQEEIARAIAGALSVQLKLGIEGEAERPTQDMEAYDNYLQARTLIALRTPDSLRRATLLLQHAVQRDPGFAKAWAYLADVHASNRFYGLGTAKESLDEAEKEARKALALDDSIAPAHAALAEVMRGRFQWLAAEAENRRAVELSPGDADIHAHYAAMLKTVGHLDAALAHARRASELEPLAWITPLFEGLNHLSRGDMTQSRDRIEQSKKISRSVQNFQLRVELLHALSSGEADRARSVLAAAPIEWPLPGDKKLLATMDNILASVAGGPDARSQLQSAFAEAQTSSGELSGHIGLAFAAVAVFAKQKEVALDALWFDFRSPAGLDSPLVWTPVFRPLWNEPRFHDLVRALKLPEYWRAAGWSDFCGPKGDNDFECIGK